MIFIFPRPEEGVRRLNSGNKFSPIADVQFNEPNCSQLHNVKGVNKDSVARQILRC
jgi:hypothetical protein